jgi:predicted TIM-barrel fold metal-dependent hydrolase
MSSGRVFDAHCHVFNLEYLLLETEQMILDALRGRYPLRRQTETKVGAGTSERGPIRDVVKKATALLRWLRELYGAAMGDERRNAEFLFTVGSEVFRKEICIMPLMMDIYYMFGPPLPLPKTSALSVFRGLMPGRALHMDEVEAEFRQVMGAFIAESEAVAKRGLFSGPIGDFSALVKKTMAEAIAFQKRDSKADPYAMTVGFEHQIVKLKELKLAYSTRVFPFLAVDPRRDGLVEYVAEGNFLSKRQGPFFGCKLYPRLGYRPDVAELDSLYARCEVLDLPVTTHCSRGGFPPPALFKDWKYDDFGAPYNYSGVLSRHPKLRLDLAHFGGGVEDRTWANAVASLMATYGTGEPNMSRVFSDLACYSAADDSDLKRWWGDFSGNELVKNQTMFGSDFDVLYFTSTMTLEAYYRRFAGGAGVPLPLSTMMGATVRRFLG